MQASTASKAIFDAPSPVQDGEYKKSEKIFIGRFAKTENRCKVIAFSQ
jgi:hypothetical protein